MLLRQVVLSPRSSRTRPYGYDNRDTWLYSQTQIAVSQVGTRLIGYVRKERLTIIPISWDLAVNDRTSLPCQWEWKPDRFDKANYRMLKDSVWAAGGPFFAVIGSVF